MVVHGVALPGPTVQCTTPGVHRATGRKAGAGLMPHYAAADVALGYGKRGHCLGASHMCSEAGASEPYPPHRLSLRRAGAYSGSRTHLDMRDRSSTWLHQATQ